MRLANDESHWGAISKWLHWLIALLIVMASLIIWHANDSTYWFKSSAPIFLKYIHWHKALGLMALVLILIRIWWRLRQPVPEVSPLTEFEQRWSRRVHIGFYVLMVFVPVSGWLSASFFGSVTDVFGLFVVPAIVPENKELVPFFYWVHFVAAWALTALFIVHVGGALYHHFIKKDRVLKAILPGED